MICATRGFRWWRYGTGPARSGVRSRPWRSTVPRGITSAMEHLTSLGHRRIAYVGKRRGRYVIHDREVA